MEKDFVIKKLKVQVTVAKHLLILLKKDQSCRVIHLGLKAYGVGKVLRRIARKVVISVIREVVVSSVGPLQVCAGHESNCEAAVNAIHSLFQQ